MRMPGLALLRCSLLSTPSFAYLVDGNRAHQWCSGDRTLLLGYGSGALDGYSVGKITGVAADAGPMKLVVEAGKLCIPQGVTLNQISDVFCKHMTKNPKDRHLPGAALIINVWQRAYP